MPLAFSILYAGDHNVTVYIRRGEQFRLIMATLLIRPSFNSAEARSVHRLINL